MITLWHNPRCSKSRQALALLEAAATQVEVRKYLEDAPSVAELSNARAAMGNPPVVKMMRTGEKIFKELGLGNNSPDATLLEAMAKHPILIERPVALKGGKAVICRPPELIKSLL